MDAAQETVSGHTSSLLPVGANVHSLPLSLNPVPLTLIIIKSSPPLVIFPSIPSPLFPLLSPPLSTIPLATAAATTEPFCSFVWELLSRCVECNCPRVWGQPPAAAAGGALHIVVLPPIIFIAAPPPGATPPGPSTPQGAPNTNPLPNPWAPSSSSSTPSSSSGTSSQPATTTTTTTAGSTALVGAGYHQYHHDIWYNLLVCFLFL